MISSAEREESPGKYNIWKQERGKQQADEENCTWKSFIVQILAFWIVMPCDIIGGYRHFGGIFRPLLQCRSVYGENAVRSPGTLNIPPKLWYPPTRLYRVTTRKMTV
jgi:hypothetical protein